MQRQAGFSTIKGMFWLALIGAAVWLAALLLPPWITYWQVQDAFESVARQMAHAQESEIRQRLPQVFQVMQVDTEDVPQAFYDNLQIEADGNRVSLSSEYRVTVWLLGPPEQVDPEDPQSVATAQGMDLLRLKGRVDFDFAPHAETP